MRTPLPILTDVRRLTGADADVIANLVELPNVHLVPGLETGADDISCVDDRMRSDHGTVADRRRSSPSLASAGGAPMTQKSSMIRAPSYTPG